MNECIYCKVRTGDTVKATAITAEGEPVCADDLTYFEQQVPIIRARDLIKTAVVAGRITEEQAKAIRNAVSRGVIAAGGQCALRVAQRELANVA